MPSHRLNHAPKHRPKSLHAYLMMAAKAHFPKNNNGLLATMFKLLSQKRVVGEGWVERAELAALWSQNGRSGRCTSSVLTKAIENLRQQLAGKLSWTLPHFSMSIEGSPLGRATRYRLKIERRERPWDFLGKEAPHTIPTTFWYRCGSGRRRAIQALVWAHVEPNREFEILADRETPNARWVPPSHPIQYYLERNTYFEEQSAKRKQICGRGLRHGDLWGITSVQVNRDRSSTVVRISTTRTAYQDLVFLKNKAGEFFSALPKNRTYGEWLDMGDEPRDTFCPPRDAMCVAVLLVTEKPTRTVFLAKPKHAMISCPPWNVTADGAAASSNVNILEQKPDLPHQAKEVLFRETGVQADEQQIVWLGFARPAQNGDSSVVAMIRSEYSVDEILQKFEHRPFTDDLECIKPLLIEDVPQWLDSTTQEPRTHLLELSLVWMLFRYGLATPA